MKALYLVFVVVFAMDWKCRVTAQRYEVTACKDGTLRLSCRIGLIQIHEVFLADSGCRGNRCCPRQTDCRGSPSAAYRSEVLSSCNGQTSCAMRVEIRNIGCSFWGPNNDYTNITYSCTAIPTSPLPTTPTTPTSTTLARSSSSTWQQSTPSTPMPIDSDNNMHAETEMDDQSTPSTSTHINIVVYSFEAIEIGGQEGNIPPYTSDAIEVGKKQSTLPLTSEAIEVGKEGNTPLYTSVAIETRQEGSTNSPYRPTSEEKKATKIEKEDTTSSSSSSSSSSSVIEPRKLNPTLLQRKPVEDNSGSEQEKVESQAQRDEGKDYGYLERVTTLVAVIVGGLVIICTVIAVAVVLVMKKRRGIVKIEQPYDMPVVSCRASNDSENVRNSNFYDFIPDSGNCSAHESHCSDECRGKENDFQCSGDDCTTKENDYLTPMTERDEAPYVWLP